jgi:copper(I)-binding protein
MIGRWLSPFVSGARAPHRALAVVAPLLALAACKQGPPLPATLMVSRAFVVLPAGQSPGALYVTFVNGTVAADTLQSVALYPDVGSVMLHGKDMAMLDRLVVPSGATVRLSPGGSHGMISSLGTLARGDSLSVTFRFARSGAVAVKARVIGYADVDTAAPPVR